MSVKINNNLWRLTACDRSDAFLEFVHAANFDNSPILYRCFKGREQNDEEEEAVIIWCKRKSFVCFTGKKQNDKKEEIVYRRFECGSRRLWFMHKQNDEEEEVRRKNLNAHREACDTLLLEYKPLSNALGFDEAKSTVILL